MKEQAGGVISSGSHVIVRKGLVIAQVALSLLLLTGAGLVSAQPRQPQEHRSRLPRRPSDVVRVQPSLNGYDAAARDPRYSMRWTASCRSARRACGGIDANAAAGERQLGSRHHRSGLSHPKEGENAPNVDAVSAGILRRAGNAAGRGPRFSLFRRHGRAARRDSERDLRAGIFRRRESDRRAVLLQLG